MAKTATKTDSRKEANKAAKKFSGAGRLHLAALIDESGSMRGNEEAVTSGYNEFLHAFKGSDNDVRAWLALFDDHAGDDKVRIKYDGKKLDKIKFGVEDYRPRGMTPLNDAIIYTIKAMDDKVGDGEKVFVIILTDGLENASETSQADVAKLIKKREKAGWGFLYLGAKHNSAQVAKDLGFSQGQAMDWSGTAKGTSASMKRSASRAQSYAASLDHASYLSVAVADSALTGGKVEEDEDE
jgi:hypothetical protein